jgi:hypothetical protein
MLALAKYLKSLLDKYDYFSENYEGGLAYEYASAHCQTIETFNKLIKIK